MLIMHVKMQKYGILWNLKLTMIVCSLWNVVHGYQFFYFFNSVIKVLRFHAIKGQRRKEKGFLGINKKKNFGNVKIELNPYITNIELWSVRN